MNLKTRKADDQAWRKKMNDGVPIFIFFFCRMMEMEMTIEFCNYFRRRRRRRKKRSKKKHKKFSSWSADVAHFFPLFSFAFFIFNKKNAYCAWISKPKMIDFFHNFFFVFHEESVFCVGHVDWSSNVYKAYGSVQLCAQRISTITSRGTQYLNVSVSLIDREKESKSTLDFFDNCHHLGQYVIP